MWEDNRGWTFSLDYYGKSLKLKHFNDGLVFLQTCIFLQDINWWSGVVWIIVFISFLDSHSDGTHSL